MGILAVTAEVEGGDIQPLNLVQGHVIVALHVREVVHQSLDRGVGVIQLQIAAVSEHWEELHHLQLLAHLLAQLIQQIDYAV